MYTPLRPLCHSVSEGAEEGEVRGHSLGREMWSLYWDREGEGGKKKRKRGRMRREGAP